MAKVRVYELAKEFGVESKAVMAKLQEMGEFVRSASSTIEAPVVRRLKEAFAGQAGSATNGNGAAPKPAAAGRRAANGRVSAAPTAEQAEAADGGPAAAAPAAASPAAAGPAVSEPAPPVAPPAEPAPARPGP